MFRHRQSRPDAAEVVSGLWLGACPNDGQALSLSGLGITHVFDLRAEAHEDSPRWPEGTVVIRSHWKDHATPTAEQLETTARKVADTWQSGETCLVHCHAGIERSPTVVMAALVLAGWPLKDAHKAVRAARHSIAPTSGQADLLAAFARRHSQPTNPTPA